jgi:hypothetical protein
MSWLKSFDLVDKNSFIKMGDIGSIPVRGETASLKS